MPDLSTLKLIAHIASGAAGALIPGAPAIKLAQTAIKAALTEIDNEAQRNGLTREDLIFELDQKFPVLAAQLAADVKRYGG